MTNDNNHFLILMLCLQTCYNCILSIIGQYIYAYFLKIYPNPPQNSTNMSYLSFTNTNECMENITNSSTWAQQESADLLFRATLWRAFPVIIVTYLYGLYASKVNRQIILILSILGNTIHVIIYQAIIYLDLSLYWWYISSFIAGFSGGTNILGIVLNLVITENTEENERSSRFVRLGAMTTALSAIVTFAIGYYIQWRGFTDLLWMAIFLQFLSILLVIFLLKPSNMADSINETTFLLSTSSNSNFNIPKSTITSYSHCFDICTVFCSENRPRKKSIELTLLIFSYVFHLLAIASMSPLLWYLLGSPFCWTSKDLGKFSAISQISTAIFSVIGMKLLNYCGASDALICALSQLCFFGYALWIALARHSWQLYLSLLINSFSGYQGSLTVPMVSKSLSISERNHVYTFVTEIHTVILAFGSSIFNWTYARTINYQQNFTFLCAAGLGTVAFVLNVFFYILDRQISDLNSMTGTLSVSIDPTSLMLQSCSSTHSFCTSLNNRSRQNSHSSINSQNEQQLMI